MKNSGTLENLLKSVGDGALSFVITAPVVCGLASITPLDYKQAIGLSAGVSIYRAAKEFYKRTVEEPSLAL